MKQYASFAIKILQGVVALVVLILVVAWMSGAFRDKVAPGKVIVAGTKAPESAQTVTVRQEAIPIFEEASGSVVASTRIAIRPQIRARIKNITVRAGDEVKAGDVLIYLDDRDLKTRVAQAQEALESAKAMAVAATFELERVTKLVERNVQTQRDLDRATADAESAQANVKRLEQAVEEANVALTYAQIQATADGRIIDRLAEPGDIASPETPIFRMYDPKTLQLEAGVRESLAAQLRIGQELRMRIDALNAEMTGEIEEIVPESEVGSRLFRVKIGLPEEERLYTGMFGRVFIPVGSREKTLIPSDYILTVGQNKFVLLKDADGFQTRRLITVGDVTGDGLIEVLSGLEGGDEIVKPT